MTPKARREAEGELAQAEGEVKLWKVRHRAAQTAVPECDTELTSATRGLCGWQAIAHRLRQELGLEPEA